MLWCIPGAPLANGRGFRLWYANPGSQDFEPLPVRVRRPGQGDTANTQSLTHLPSVDGLDRRFALVDVELAAPAPGQLFDVYVPEIGETYRWSTRPTSIPEHGLSLLLISCFWVNDDRDGAFTTALMNVIKRERPAFRFNVGDQLYMDWPSSFSPFATAASLTAERYQSYWGNDAYREALAALPNFFVCDDHEYWNDYPEFQIHLRRTQTEANREEYGRISEDYYRVFQRCLNPNGEARSWIEFDVDPVSFFLADTRSERTYYDGRPNPLLGEDPQATGRHFMSSAQWDALEHWQQQLTGPGVLVLGQPLFQEDGDWRDHSLSNFSEDYSRLMRLFERSQLGDNASGEPHDILVLSGDIHTGRTARALTTTGERIHELIASPASRVGPFTSQPTACKPPSRITGYGSAGDAMSWSVARDGDEFFSTLHNNLGVLRLFPARKHPYALRVEFDSCFVRKPHLPPWTRAGQALAFWRRREPDITPGTVLNPNDRSIYLR